MDRIWSFKKLMIIFGLTCVLCGFSIGLGNWIVGKPSFIHIEEVIMTSDIDERGLPVDHTFNFNQTDSRIYCLITITGPVWPPLSTSMLAQWYYGEDEIAGHYFKINSSRPAIIWIEPPEGDLFHKGSYTIKFFDQHVLLKTFEFRVE